MKVPEFKCCRCERIILAGEEYFFDESDIAKEMLTESTLIHCWNCEVKDLAEKIIELQKRTPLKWG